MKRFTLILAVVFCIFTFSCDNIVNPIPIPLLPPDNIYVDPSFSNRYYVYWSEVYDVYDVIRYEIYAKTENSPEIKIMESVYRGRDFCIISRDIFEESGVCNGIGPYIFGISVISMDGRKSEIVWSSEIYYMERR